MLVQMTAYYRRRDARQLARDQGELEHRIAHRGGKAAAPKLLTARARAPQKAARR